MYQSKNGWVWVFYEIRDKARKGPCIPSTCHVRFEYLHQWAGGEVPMRLYLFPAGRLNWNIHLETVLHDVWCEYRRGLFSGNRVV